MIEALLGLDIGTSSTKGVLFDTAGQELARAESKPYPILTEAPGWVEQDHEVLWNAVLGVLRDVLSDGEQDLQVKAVSMAAQSGSVLAADPKGNPLTNLITWLDGRTKELVDDWKSQGLESQVRSLSGWSLYPGLPLHTIAWLRAHAADVHQKTGTFFSANDYLAFRLTGERVTNPSNAGGMQLIDIHQPDWHDELCALAGINPSLLSQILPSGARIGEIHSEICLQVGLPEGTPLINGGHDQACTALGLGLLKPGQLLLACGTAWVYSSPTLDPRVDKLPDQLDLNYHAIEKAWVLSQSLGGLGASLSWWIDQTGSGTRQERYQSFATAIEDTAPNKGLFFRPLTGGFDDPATTRSGGFVGLRLDHTWGDMGRAVLESPGYELRQALENWLDDRSEVDYLWMVGGAASSMVWPKILTSLLGISIRIPEYDNWPALGAAILAGTGSGIFQDVDEALRIFERSFHSVEPDPELQEQYDSIYPEYLHQRDNWINKL